MLRLLVGIGIARSRGVATLDELLDSLEHDLKEAWAGQSDKLEGLSTLRSNLFKILTQHYVRTVVKAIDVSYEYANLLQSSRVMTMSGRSSMMMAT